MASFPVDESWGHIFDDIFSGAGSQNRGKSYLLGVQTALAQQKRDEAAKLGVAIDALVDKGNKAYEAMPPPPTTLPPLPNVQMDPSGKATWSMEPADSTGAPLSFEAPRDWGLNEGFYTWRDREKARAAAAARLATSAQDLAKAGPLLDAYGQLNLYGVPGSQAERDVMQTQLTGQIPGYDEKSAKATNYAIHDPNTGQTRIGGRTVDGKTDFNTGQPIATRPGEIVLATGAADVGGSAFDPKMAHDDLTRLASKVDRGEPLTEQEAQRANVRLNQIAPETLEERKVGGRSLVEAVRKQQIPALYGNLAGLVDAYNRGDHRVPPPAVPGAPSPAPAAAPPAAPAVPPPAVPGAAPAAVPGVIPQNTPRIVSDTMDAPALRKEYVDQRVVNRMEQAKGAYANVVANMKYNNKGADLAIVIGLAKLLDPESVVRGTEGDEVRKTGGPADYLAGLFNQIIGGSGLDRRVRLQLKEVADRTFSSYVSAAAPFHERYSNLARKGGLNPDEQLGALPGVIPLDPKEISSINTPDVWNDGSIAVPRTRAAAPATVAPPPSPAQTPQPTPRGPVDHDAVRRLLGVQ